MFLNSIMGELENYIEKENLHSSWIRNMFQMITMGLVLITFFRDQKSKKLKKYIFIPIIIIIIGIIVGIYSVYYTYFQSPEDNYISRNKFYTWKYLSILLCIIFILVAFYIIKYYDP